jgi:hypothetical protein
MNTSRLLVALLRRLTALLPLATTALLRVLALMVLGLAQSPTCHLSTLATVLPCEGQRENLIQRLRRWLKAPTLSWERYYRPLVRQFLANWQGVEIALVMASNRPERPPEPAVCRDCHTAAGRTAGLGGAALWRHSC